MSERHRPRFQCWQCNRTFHQTVEIGDDPVLLLECPFCAALARVDLDPYRETPQTRSCGATIPG